MTEQTANSEPHFKISAAVVKQLGEELVSDEVTAFMELVKNAYDADATKVLIDINTNESCANKYLLDEKVIIAESINLDPKEQESIAYKPLENTGFISIKDNGSGMSRVDIIDKWMTISLSEKRDAAKSGRGSDKGRSYLGEKGVGRLSTQRLGRIIDLITGKKDEDHYTHVYFDWEAFSENITLDRVKPGFKEIPKTRSESGTEIIIRGLKSNDVWEGGSYSKILGQLSQLISPKPNIPGGGFRVNIKKNNSVEDLVDINKSIEEAYVSSFTFKVTMTHLEVHGIITTKKLFGSTKENHQNYTRFIAPDNGKDFYFFLSNKEKNKKEYLSNISYNGKEGKLFDWKIEIDINQIPELIRVEKRDNYDNLILDEDGLLIYELAHPGPFSGKINDYSYAKDFGQVLDTTADIKTIIQNKTGIRVYRDGFGIKPYGINSQDWLKLGSGSTRGGSYYGLRPFNVVGYIEISAKDNFHLREKTDREGFIESPHSGNFFKIADFIVKQINTTLEKTRRGFNEYIKYIAAENIGIDPIQDSFNNLIATAQTSRQLEQRMASINYRLSEAKEKIKEVNLKPNSGVYNERTVSDQLTVLNTLLEDSNFLVEEISSILVETRKLDQHVDIIKPQIESLENQLMEFTDLASLGLTAEALSHELSNIADKLYEETNSIIKRYARKIPDELVQVSVFLESVRSSVTSFRKQLSHLDPALKYVRESRETFTLASFFKELSDYYVERFGDKIDIVVTHTDKQAKVTVNKGKFIQIIDNIILNAEYWLKEKIKQNKHFQGKIFIETAPPYIRIYDNGQGIPHMVEETIFQPFVTLKPRGVGRGLGLFIVQQLLDSIGCSITLLPERNADNNRYIFQLYINAIS